MSRSSRDTGAALATVVMMVMFVSLALILLLKVASSEYQHSRAQEREDVVVAGAEAILDRYAAKLTIDPRYYLHWVDEAERARRCETVGAPEYGQLVEPGNPWDELCDTWTYEDPDPNGDGITDWFVHPVLDTGSTSGDIGVLLEVTPPSTGPVQVLVVGKRGSSVQRRAITAGIHPTSLSEFYRVTQNDLAYGDYAETFGKIYSGGDINFGNNTTAHANVYAEGRITSAPSVWADGAEGFTHNGIGGYGDIRNEYPQPLDFNNFWDDLDLIQQSACGGGGVCLDDSDAKAWLVQEYVSAGVGKLQIWKSTASRTDTAWWTTPTASGANWTLWGTVDVPSNGTLWANARLVVGDQHSSVGVDVAQDGDSLVDCVLKGSLTMYAGSNASPKDVIINADTFYDDPNSLDTLALISSDEIVINGSAVGSDREFYINAALLGQSDAWRFASDAPSESTLHTYGSIATLNVGDIAAHIKYRDYGFDPRLEYVRPPMFPLLDPDWNYDDWRETPLPDWAKP
jgi:hypothetical protein